MTEEIERIVPAVEVLARLLRVLQAPEAGISLAQYRFLARLRAGGDRSARLAEEMRVQKPTVTALADGLVAAGLATRERDTGDRRAVRLALTDDGQAALDKAERALAERLQPIFADLDDPLRFLDDLMELGAVLDVRFSRKHHPAS